MQIYVGKNGQQLGPFSLEEINRKLADRTFAGTDLAWYEGAAGWAPLSGVAGVVLPSAAAPAPAPIPAATQPTAPAAVPVRSNASIVQPPAGDGTKTLAMVSWILMGITLVISFIPVLGCGSWILVWPVAVAAIIMGIIIMTRGRTGKGVALILGAVLLVPLSFLAQFVSLMIFGGALSEDRKYETQIRDNLRTVETAKGQFVTQTKAADGSPVTMASLASYLTGKEIKPAVGEQYDPMPVGQAPTATLPATKSLGDFKGGDVLTIASLETALSNFSANKSWSWMKSTQSPSPRPSVSPVASPKATAAPTVTATPSAKPSVSPKSSSPPHSLISPRQSVEPEESPSSRTRPSPSAKFAPRDGPRMGPRKSPSEAEQSGGLRQGKQHPPRELPSATPDDDDE